MTAMADPTAFEAVTAYFKVKIDDIDGTYDLGTFISCEGLSLTIHTDDYVEGGTNTHTWKLPTRMTYDNVTLKRPLGPEAVKLGRWFTSLGRGVKRTTASITALTPAGDKIVEWALTGVIPVRWQGPSFSADSPALATETLEIAHHGFVVT